MGKSPATLRLVVSLAGLALLAAAAPARADDDSAAVEKISKLNKKAVDEFENLNFDQARKILKDALDACSRAGLDSSQVAARTHVHLGVVLFAGFKQKDEAVVEFKKALEMAPDVKLDKLLATPEIQEVFDQAVSEQKGEAGGSGAKAAAPAAADAITHEPVTRAAQGKSIQINMTLDSSVKAKKVMLSFSADGSEDFGEREMQEQSPGNWMGEIPSSATQGAKVSYYIEVDGADDQVVAKKGSAAEPMVVELRGPDGAPLGQKKKVTKTMPKKEAPEGASWYVGLGVGSGFGWTSGTGEINPADKVKPAGFAPATLGQVSPELGYFLSPDLVLSLQVRFQLVSGMTTFTGGASPPSTAIAGFARARWLFDAGDVHPFVGALVGGGTIRHVASFNSVPTCGSSGKQTCVDSIKAGPIFVGGTGGVIYNVTPTFGLTGETNLALGFTNFTFNVDINVGVALEF